MKKKFTYIQILRAIAASIVVVHHFYKAYTGNRNEHLWWHTSGMGELGQAGVDIFFAISGFIMFYTQFSGGNKLAAVPGTTRAFQFFKKRVVRIYPLYWFWTTFLVVLWQLKLVFATKHLSALYVAMSYVLFPWRSDDGLIHPLLDQGWTLSLEMYFYVVFSITLYFCHTLKSFGYMAAFFGINYLLTLVVPLNANWVYLVSHPLIIEFLYGGIIAIIVLHWNTTISRNFFLGLLVFGFVALAVAGLWAYTESLRFLAYGIPAAVIVLAAGMADKLATSSSDNYLTYLGDASYTIYLTHGFFSLGFGFVLKRGMLYGWNPDVLIGVGALLTIWVTAFLYPLVEKPITKKVQQWIQ